MHPDQPNSHRAPIKVGPAIVREVAQGLAAEAEGVRIEVLEANWDTWPSRVFFEEEARGRLADRGW